MFSRISIAKLIGIVAAMVVSLPGLAAVSAPAVQDQALVSPALVPVAELPLFSNFDDDSSIDQAELSSYGSLKTIDVTLGNSLSKSLSFDSGEAEPGGLVSEDIDWDGDTDLVWVSEDDPGKFVAWFGDGRGDFSRNSETVGHLVRLPSLSASESVVGHVIGDELACVLLAAGFVGLPAVEYSAVLPYSFRTISSTGSPSLRAPFPSVLCKRGPPPSSY